MARLETAAGSRRAAWAVPFVLAVLTLLVSPDLMPAYSEINPFDEAKYIESGRLLLTGELRDLPWGPLVALAYAPFHLIFGNSPNWFVIEAWSGRILLFLALWLSTYHLSLQFKIAARRYMTMGVLFISTAFFDVLKNPSDALFAVFASLSLARLMVYYDRKNEAEIWRVSALLGMAVLARFEAIVLVPCFLVAVLIIRRALRPGVRWLLASLLPAAAIVGGYVLAFRLTSPGMDLGIAGKSYDSFEVNQPVSGTGTRSDRRELARSLFGTSEENRGSVVRAILRNPGAFAGRLLTNIGGLPDLFLFTFGKRIGPALLLFAAFGTYCLVRTRRWAYLGFAALWSAPALVSLAFLPLHIVRQLSHLVLVLSAIGLTASVSDTLALRERHLPWIAALALGVYGLVDAKLAFLTVGVVLAGAWAFLLLTRPSHGENGAEGIRASALFLAAGLILRGAFPFPNYPQFGTTPQEQVVHYLQEELPRGSRILESDPLPAVAAKMAEDSWGGAPRDITTSAELRAWLRSEDIDAVFVDSRDVPRPELVALLEAGLGSEFLIGHQSEDGRLRVYMMLDQANH